jgi:hypothetical protein
LLGISATSSPWWVTRIAASAVTTPTIDASSPHFAKTRSTSPSRPFSATSSMRSWLSEHDLVARHAGLALRNQVELNVSPTPPRAPISQVEQVSPAAPMS